MSAKSYTVKNGAMGARGVGSKLIEAGAEVVLELDDEEAVLLSELDGIELTEAKPAKGKAKADDAE